MNPLRIIGRLAAIVAGVAGAVMALGATPAFAVRYPIPAGPAVTTTPLPKPPGWNKHPPLTPAHVHAALAGGIPGWQIALITAGAALAAAAIAVLLNRARAPRRHVTATAA